MQIPEEENQKKGSSSSKTTEENLKTQWTSWLLETSKGLQPIFKETIISVTFILGDLLIIWLAGFAFADVISRIPLFEWMYQGIKIASVTVISFHYLGNCIIEINKSKKNLTAEIFSKEQRKKVDTI